MKRKWKAVLAAAACYALLLGLLTICEGRAPEGHIRTLADAFWYSVVTMTTVGYGDLYPVTITGRLIGLLLMMATAVHGLFECQRREFCAGAAASRRCERVSGPGGIAGGAECRRR